MAGTGALLIAPVMSGCNGRAQSSHTENKGKYSGTIVPSDKRKRYLFLDDHWISRQSGVTRTFHKAVRDNNNPVITRQNYDKGVGPYNFSWIKKDSPYSALFGTFELDGRYPAFFITSDDGYKWSDACREPDAMTVGEGNKQCAIYVYDKSGLYSDYPYLSAVGLRFAPDCDSFHWRFRRSRDGIRWETFPVDPVWDGPSDVLSIIWDDYKKKYVAYYKVWRYKGTTLEGEPFVAYGHLDTKIEEGGTVFHLTGTTYLPRQKIDVRLQYGGDTSNDGGGAPTDAKMQMARMIAYAESSDFLHWENEQIIIAPPDDAPLGDQSYGMGVNCYGGMYIGMYSHFNSLTGLIQPMVAWSYDGIHFTVHDRQFFIDSGKRDEWDYGYILPSELMETDGGQLFVYYGSLGIDHLETDMTRCDGGIGRAWIRQDGFASLKGGWMETIPLKVQRKRMSINMTGEIVLSLKSASGETIGKKTALRGDHHNLEVGIDLSAWNDKEVIVHLDLSKGEVFSITI